MSVAVVDPPETAVPGCGGPECAVPGSAVPVQEGRTSDEQLQTLTRTRATGGIATATLLSIVVVQLTWFVSLASIAYSLLH